MEAGGLSENSKLFKLLGGSGGKGTDLAISACSMGASVSSSVSGCVICSSSM